MKRVLKNLNRHLHNLQLSRFRWSERMKITALSGINDIEKWENGGLLTASLSSYIPTENILAGPFNTVSGKVTPP